MQHCKSSPHPSSSSLLPPQLFNIPSSGSTMNNILRPSFFDFTELVRLVAQHLSQHEIVQCMQVSKQFALQFEPMLWEHLDFTEKTPPSTEASYRNLFHIRSITMDG